MAGKECILAIESDLRPGNHPIFHGIDNWTSRDLFQFHGRYDLADHHFGPFVVVNP